MEGGEEEVADDPLDDDPRHLFRSDEERPASFSARPPSPWMIPVEAYEPRAPPGARPPVDPRKYWEANKDKIAEARKKTRGEATTPDSTPVAMPAAAGGTRVRGRRLQQQGGRCVQPRGEQPRQWQPTQDTRGQNAARLGASTAADLQVAKSQEDQGAEVNDRDENTIADERGAKRGRIMSKHQSAEDEPPMKVKKGDKHTRTATSVWTRCEKR